MWIISNLVETKMDFISEKFFFQPVLWARETLYCEVVPCPGKKTFASSKKAVIPVFEMRASTVSARRSLCHRISLRKQRRETLDGFSRSFLSSAPAFLPGQQRNRLKRPTKL